MRIGRMMVVMAALLMLAATALARHRSSPSLPVVEVHGVIKNVSATEMVVTDSASHDVTVKISAETIFRSGDLALGPSTLKTGDRVEVKATVKDNVLTALLVSLEDNQNQQQEELDISGVIKSVSSSQLVVTDAHAHDTTVKITADTIIQKGGHAATTADLAVGDRVEVKATVSGTVNTAVMINVETPELENEDVSGTVKAVGTGQITVTTHDHGDIVVKIDANTRIRKDDRTIAIGDIHTGDQVDAQGTRVDDHTMLARDIEVHSASENQQPELLEIDGVVKSVSSSQLVVTDEHALDTTVKITADTIIRKGGHAATAADLAVGDRVEVKATVSGTVNTAVMINVEAPENEN